MAMRTFSVPENLEDCDNPHACIQENVPCLCCALIEVMGFDRRKEALDLAGKLSKAKGE